MSYVQPPDAGGNAGPSPVERRPGFELNEFLAFRYLITPGLVTVIYVIGAVFITLGALVLPASGGQGGAGIIAGVLVLVFGNLYWRVILEFIMVLFRINDSLASIERHGRGM